MFNENKFTSITDTIRNSKEFITQINKENEVVVLSNNKPTYVAMSWEHYKILNQELEYLREFEKNNQRLNSLNEIEINDLKSHIDLKEEGLLE